MNRILNITKSGFSFLKDCFKLIIPAVLLFSLQVSAQQTAITGTVTGENNTPLQGVSVNVKGSSKGTFTNAAGKFTISAPPDATIVFSSIGFTNQEIAVAGKTDIAVSLAISNKELEQVVVVGYGTQRKIDVTGSVATVKGADIAKQPVLTATQAIQGRVAGVQIISSGDPNSSPTVRIRGVGTMLGGASPLYVVDGVITDDIRNINSA
ncbi:MAG: carboxypeptidase-like regulatory domain-containing protein, partial [Segetibacter sp.]